MTIVHLTTRQQEVAALVAEAWTTKRIATQLHISPRRVRATISTIGRRLGAGRDREARVLVARMWLEASHPRTDAEGALSP